MLKLNKFHQLSYGGLGSVRLGSFRLRQVRLGYVGFDQVRLGYVE